MKDQKYENLEPNQQFQEFKYEKNCFLKAEE